MAGLHSSLPADQIVPRAIRLKLAPRYCDWPLEADRSNARDDLLKSSFAPSAWVRYSNFRNRDIFNVSLVHGISSIEVRRAMLKKKSRLSKRYESNLMPFSPASLSWA